MLERRAGGAPSAARATLLAGALGALALGLAGCGGGSRLDAGEPSGTFAVQLVHASFPSSQAISRPTSMQIQVRNAGARAVPDVAVTVDSFEYASDYKGLADDKRPVWVIEQGPGARAQPPVETQEVSTPGSAQTAYVNTWALGRLAPGQTQTFTWHVVPVKSGMHTVHFSVAAGLAGKAKAKLSSGAAATGQFTVDIAPAPRTTHVDPSTGQVIAGAYPAYQAAP